MREFSIHTDGAARGNPGPAAWAFVLSHDGEAVLEEKEFMGESTNNVAEYTALVKALERALEMGGTHVVVHSDSELMVKQMNGEYKVKNEGLIPLYEEARRLSRRFERVTLRHVRRGENKEADRLCNEALDEAKRRPGGTRPTPAKAAPAPTPKSASPAQPPARRQVSEVTRREALAYLKNVAEAWSDGDTDDPTPEEVLRKLLGILEIVP